MTLPLLDLPHQPAAVATGGTKAGDAVAAFRASVGRLREEMASFGTAATVAHQLAEAHATIEAAIETIAQLSAMVERGDELNAAQRVELAAAREAASALRARLATAENAAEERAEQIRSLEADTTRLLAELSAHAAARELSS